MTLIESLQKHRGYKCEAVCCVCLCVSWSCCYYNSTYVFGHGGQADLFLWLMFRTLQIIIIFSVRILRVITVPFKQLLDLFHHGIINHHGQAIICLTSRDRSRWWIGSHLLWGTGWTGQVPSRTSLWSTSVPFFAQLQQPEFKHEAN